MIFFVTLLLSSLIMSLIMLFLFVFSSAIRRKTTAKTRYTMWIILLLGLVIPVRPILGSGLITVEPPLQQALPSHVEMAEEEVFLSAPSTGFDSVEPTVQLQSMNVLPTLQKRDPYLIAYALLAIWAIGAIVLFSKYMIEYRKFRQLLKRWGTDVDDPDTLKLFGDVKLKMGLGEKEIRLVTFPFVNTPMLTGLFRPIVILPQKDSSTDEMRLILEHELTHYKHNDLWVNLLGITALCLHWFNPIVYLCLPTVYGDGESYCDETVLNGKDLDYRRFYGEMIIDMIEVGQSRPIALSTCFYAKKLNIKRRLFNIMETNKNIKKLSKGAIALVLGLSLVSNSVVVFANPRKSSNIGVEKAKAIALRDAGLKAKNVGFVRAALDTDDGKKIYDVEFYSNGKEYDYEIDAATGKILEKDTDIENYVAKANNTNTKSASSAKGSIGSEKAKAIALKDAGLKASNVAFVKVQLDYDDGRQIYDVEFYSNGREYDYEIDAVSGKILEKDSDIENYTIPQKQASSQTSAKNNGSIGVEKAKSIALKHAGISASNAQFIKAELDHDDGRKVYEVEFLSNGKEYNYDIDAASGKVLSFESEYDND